MTDQSTGSATFVKADTGKARPGLIPVMFRRGLREAEEDRPAPHLVDMCHVYGILERYEEGESSITTGTHTVVQAAQYLQKLCSNYISVSHGPFLLGLARVFAMGAVKYSVDNWKNCPYEDRHRYIDAFYRHTYAWEHGENIDSESGEHHLFHAGCCLAMLHGIDVIRRIVNPAPVEKEAVVRAMDEIVDIILEPIVSEKIIDKCLKTIAQAPTTAERNHRKGYIVDGGRIPSPNPGGLY